MTTKNGDLSATEKLLQMIREDQREPADSGPRLQMFEQPAVDPPLPQPSSPLPAASTVSPREDSPRLLEEKKSAFTRLAATLFPREPWQSVRVLAGFSPIRVGVALEADAIHLVKLRGAARAVSILDTRSVPLAHPIDPADPESAFSSMAMREALQDALHQVCGRPGRHEIWASLHADPAEIVCVTVPAVSDKDLPNAVFWSAKKEKDFDVDQVVFDYAVASSFEENNQRKLLCLAYLLPKVVLVKIQTLFQGLGYPLTGFTFPGIAVQNLLQASPATSRDETLIHLHFLQEASRIDLHHRGRLLFSRDIKTGLTSFLESAVDRAAEGNIIIGPENAQACVIDTGTPPRPDDVCGQINIAELQATGRLARQITRTVEFCVNHFRIPRVTRVLLSGPFPLRAEILQELGTDLDASFTLLDPTPLGLLGDTPAATNPIRRRHGLLVAYGLAMSSRASTPNFLLTFREKRQAAVSNRINQGIAVFTIILALLAGVVFAIEHTRLRGQRAERDRLSQELARRFAAEPRSRDPSFALAAMGRITKHLQDTKDTVRRFSILAILGGIFENVPSSMRLTGVDLDLAPRPADGPPRDPKAAPSSGQFRLNGFIRAPSQDQEFILLAFLKDLRELPYGADPRITAKRQGGTEGDEFLVFHLLMDLKPEMARPQ